MPNFGDRSLRFLSGVHPDLRKVAAEAIKHIDFTITCGQRGKAAQDDAFRRGHSKAKFGQSPHNFAPALAFDFIPYPFEDADWKRPEKFAAIAAVIKQAAKTVGVDVTWGGDFRSFKDSPHIELTAWRTIRGELAE